MSDKKLMSAAIATSLAVSGAQAATDAAPEDIIGGAQDAIPGIVAYNGNDALDASLEHSIDIPEGDDDLIDFPIIPGTATDVHGDEGEVDIHLAQTYYGGGSDDKILKPRAAKPRKLPGAGGQVASPKLKIRKGNRFNQNGVKRKRK